MKISVLVVTYNEEKRLKDCLQSLKKFPDIIVADIGSTDRSVEIAQEMGVKVIHHAWVPIGEMVIPSVISIFKNDWLIRVDPDEILPQELVNDLILLEVDDKTGIIQIPYQYYFLGRKLGTTVWGGLRLFPRIIHRKRVDVNPSVHQILSCNPGYQEFIIPPRPENAVQHYWIDSCQQLWEKHWRYIKMEGEARYKDGKRFSLTYLCLESLKALYISLISKQGWQGGLTGIFLSLFYAWYNFMSIMSLGVYQLGKLRQNNK